MHLDLNYTKAWAISVCIIIGGIFQKYFFFYDAIIGLNLETENYKTSRRKYTGKFCDFRIRQIFI